VLIEDREMAATILQDGYGQGQRCVEIAAKLVNNEAVEYSDLATKSVFFPVMPDSFCVTPWGHVLRRGVSRLLILMT
jgi:hypothetical protein